MLQQIALLDDALLPDDPDALAEQIQDLTRKEEKCERLIARLCAQESVPEGIFFAQEIHAAKQRKCALRVQRVFRTAKRKRLLLGMP